MREILSSAFVERASEQLPWFVVVLLVSVAITSLVSRERRRRLGLTRFLLGYLCIAAVPLFGVIVLRSALREGLEQAGHGWWAALWLSLFSMVIFIVVAQWVVRRMPPTRGWLRAPGWAGTENNDAGAPVGLLQLTDPDSFWVLGSDADLADVAATAKELAPFRQGFDRLTAYFGPDDRIGCLRLPVVCREPLEDELIVQGVDIEPRFWE